MCNFTHRCSVFICNFTHRCNVSVHKFQVYIELPLELAAVI